MPQSHGAAARRTPRAGLPERASRCRSEELRLGRRRCTDMGAAELRDRAAARRPLDEAELEQVRLVDVLDRLLLLAERRRERREADGPSLELLRDRAEQLTGFAVEALLV